MPEFWFEWITVISGLSSSGPDTYRYRLMMNDSECLGEIHTQPCRTPGGRYTVSRNERGYSALSDAMDQVLADARRKMESGLDALIRFKEDQEVDDSISSKIEYWPGIREGKGITSKTRSEAQLLGGHTPVVWVEDQSGCIALTHIRPM